MTPEQLARDALTPEALGLEPAAFDTLLARVLSAAALAYPDSTAAQGQHALAYLYGMEAQHWRRQISSGSGAEGSYSLSEVSARMSAALSDRDAARAELARLTPDPVTVKAGPRVGVPIVFEV